MMRPSSAPVWPTHKARARKRRQLRARGGPRREVRADVVEPGGFGVHEGSGYSRV